MLAAAAGLIALCATSMCPAQTPAVGTTAGQFEVDASGAASYTIPITVPPGIGGLQPDLAIVYSSMAGPGLLGVGFGLSGTSEIRRCARTLARDGIVDGVEFDLDDAFCLDGRRLIRIVGTTWRPEIEDFSLVQGSGSHLDPASFTVRTKAGLTMTYGGTADARVTAQGRTDGKAIAWLLNRVTDSAGNAMTWTYQQDQASGEVFPVAVDYAYAGTLPRARVSFQYRLAQMPSFSYVAGSRETSSRLLQGVQTHYTSGSGLAIARSYTLAYDDAGQAGRHRLVTITECGHVGSTQCFQATTFGWSNAAPAGYAARIAPGYFIGDGTRSEGNGISRTHYGDFDGDGRTDLYVVTSSTDVLSASSIHLSRPSGAFESRTGPAHHVGSGDDVGVDLSRVKIADLNADGYSDVLRINGKVTPSASSIYLNDRAGGFRAPVAGPAQRVNTDDFKGYRDTSRLRFGDFDGDGVTDIAIVEGTNVTQPISLHLNNRQGTAFTYQAGPTISIPDGFRSSACAVDGVKMGDFDGDALTDFYVIAYSGSGSSARTGVMHLNNGNGTWRSISSGLTHPVSSAGDDCSAGMGAVVAADMNGDGLTDLMRTTVGSGTSEPMTIWYSRGNGSFETVLGPAHFTSDDVDGVLADQNRVKIGDFNGDGLADLLILTGWGSATSRLLLNRGFVANGVAQFLETPGPASFHVRANEHEGNDVRRVTPVDFNGTGALQVHRIDACCERSSASTITAFGYGAGADRLVNVANGLGAHVTVAYKPLTDGSVYRRTAPGTVAWPQVDLFGPIYVVASHSASDGLGSLRTVQYRYEDGLAHLDGRGSAGFRRWSSVDAASGIGEFREMMQTFPWSGSPTRVERRVGDCLVSSRQTQYDRRLLPGTRHFPFARSIVESEHELGTCGAGSPAVTSKVTELAYEEATAAFHGNLTQSTVRLYEGSSIGGVQTHLVTTRHQYADDEASWHLGRLVRSEVLRESGGTTGTRTSSFEYDPVTGLLAAETIEPDAGAELRLRTEYTRSANGNLVQTRVKGTADPAQDRLTRVVYDSAGQFPVRSINALGHERATTTHPDSGNPATASDENGLVTAFAYDAFGRAVKVTRPDGTTRTTTRRWCSTGASPSCAANAVLRVEQAGSDGSRSWRDLDRLERQVGGGRIGFDGTPIVWMTEYNARGEVTRRSNPAFLGDPVYWTVYTYDGLGRVLTEAAPRNQGGGARTTRFAYDGRTTTQTDPRGNRTTRTVDAAGKLVAVTDAASNVTTFRHDAFDNLVATVDPEGNGIVSTFDVRGRRLSTRDPDLGLWSYGYNGFGQLVWQRDAAGRLQTFAYDALGRSRSRSEAEGATTWTWDNPRKGALSSVSSPGGYVRVHTYDNRGRPLRTTETLGGVSFAFTRSYDAQGRLLTLQYPGGTSIRYGYNAHGYLQAVTDAAQKPYWTGIAQDALGNWTLYRTGNDVETLRSHDQANGWLQTILSGHGTASAANVQSLNLFWDDNGNLAQRIDQRQGGLTESFTYDELDRVRSARLTGSGGAAVPDTMFAYDAIGNLVEKSDVGAYAYEGDRPHAVSSTSGVAGRAGHFTYDANGNQLSGLGRTLEWTSFNLPRRITQGAHSIAYEYGPERQVTHALSVLPPTDTSANDILYAGGGLYEQHRRGNVVTHRFSIEVGGQPVGTLVVGNQLLPSKTMRYEHHDHLDSASVVTVGTAVIERHAYDAFGKRRHPDGRADGSDEILTTTHESDRGFTGHEHADHVGLIHMGGRVYDPILGRFTSPDPFVQFPDNGQAYNRYSYVLNNPLSNTDPSGFFLKRIKRELRRWERDFRHEIRRPNSYLGSAIRVVGAAASYYCGHAYAACVAGVEAATSRAQGVEGAALVRNTAIAAGAAIGFDFVGSRYAAGSVSNVVGHGVVGGLSSLAAGEDVGPGFLAGSLSAWGGAMVPDSAIAGSVAAAVLGGTVSEIGGGTFANGAVTGAFGHLFNRCRHGACDTDLEQGLYDWWPGYKFGTGLSNVMNGGEMTGWEILEGASLGLGVTAKGINLAFSGGSRSVFWAGFDQDALTTARTLGVTLDKTLGGGLMNWLEYEARIVRFPKFMWRWASATFARNASGTATAVIRAPGETWLTVERPILIQRGIEIRHVP